MDATALGKTHDLGRKVDATKVSAPYASDVKSSVQYPSLTLHASELPAVASWKVGGTYTLTIEVKMVGHALQGTASRGDFEVRKAKVEPLGFAKG